MSDYQKEAATKTAEAMSKLPRENLMYILGYCEGVHDANDQTAKEAERDDSK